MNTPQTPNVEPTPLHEEIHTELRLRLITGRIVPGLGLSTRRLADELGVSQMPVREALSRLAAEGAVEIRSKRRIQVPPMTRERFDDLQRCRLLLEPLSAKLAIGYIDPPTLDRLRHYNQCLDLAMQNGDINSYMEANYLFHFSIYRAHPHHVHNRLIESLWVQFGPFMRFVFSRIPSADLVDQHELALEAIARGDAEALATAIHQDIADGMTLIDRNGVYHLG